LLIGGELVQHLHVAGVGSRAVARLRGDVATPKDLRQRRIVAVRQARAVIGIRQEHVPQSGFPRAPLQLLHHRRLVVGVAGFDQLALVHGLGGIDVLVHERAQTLLELDATLARLEVHRLLLGSGNRIIADERGIGQLQGGGRRL
jgi:hypothetical protein